jgi:hypothetical protein
MRFVAISRPSDTRPWQGVRRAFTA